MAANDKAAIDHQLMPFEPVWLATITGSVLVSVLVNSAAKKYSFQGSTSERMNAATIPGKERGTTILKKTPHTAKTINKSGLQ